MERNRAKWLALAAAFLFVAAVFQIADGTVLPGAVFFGAAVCFSSAAAAARKKERESSYPIQNEVQDHAEH